MKEKKFDNERKINIIGAGLAGLSASIHLAKAGYPCRLISLQPSERAQSVMAEGGINAALDTMGEHDEPLNHYHDTIKGGVYLADENAVWNLTSQAPDIVRWLCSLGAPFNREGDKLELRNFGGQKKKRTAYSRSSTGKILMTALIDEARKYESRGLIRRYPHHRFSALILTQSDDDPPARHKRQKNQDSQYFGESHGAGNEKFCAGAVIKDIYTGEDRRLYGPVILATGGMNSLFPGMTTGTAVNTGDVTATVFSQGVSLANLEFIQYHPTTAKIPDKRCLISEAARGEGGRLFVFRNGEPWYFMEEKYPELKNLMPRDVVSREMVMAAKTEGCEDKIYLDMTHIGKDIWERKLSDLREECVRLFAKDPKTEYLEVSPGIHYFMGGIYVNERHETNVKGLYAAGECACQYHGANRLGGNSMLGAVFGGKIAAGSAAAYADSMAPGETEKPDYTGMDQMTKTFCQTEIAEIISDSTEPADTEPYHTDLFCDYAVNDLIAGILKKSMGIFRTEDELSESLEQLNSLNDTDFSSNDKRRLLLAKAMVMSALNRKESRGAHTRLDYPERNDKDFQKTTVISYDGECIHLSMCDIAKREGTNREPYVR